MDATIETIESVPILSITERVRMDEIGERIGALMPELMAVAGPVAAGPVIARWRAAEDDADERDMELGLPVRTTAPAAGRVVAGRLPGGRALVVWHVGHYDGLTATWAALTAWMKTEGHVCRADPWEEYTSDCAVTPPDELRTRIVWPIE